MRHTPCGCNLFSFSSLYAVINSCTGGDMSPPYIRLHYISKNRWDWKLPPISLSFALILNDLRLHAEGFIKDG